MMCGNCENHVRKALEDMGVTVTEVSHEKGTAIIETDNTDTKALKQAIEGAGYKVTKFI